MLRRTIWSVSPLAAGEVTALSSLSASLWPREAAPHTGQQTSGELFRRHGWTKCRGVLLRRGRARSQEQGCNGYMAPVSMGFTHTVSVTVFADRRDVRRACDSCTSECVRVASV